MAIPTGSHANPWESSGNHGNRWQSPRELRDSLCDCRAKRASKGPLSLTIAIGSHGDCRGFPWVLVAIGTDFSGFPWQSPQAPSPWAPTGTPTGTHPNPRAPVAISMGAHRTSRQPVAVVEGAHRTSWQPVTTAWKPNIDDCHGFPRVLNVFLRRGSPWWREGWFQSKGETDHDHDLMQVT